MNRSYRSDQRGSDMRLPTSLLRGVAFVSVLTLCLGTAAGGATGEAYSISEFDPQPASEPLYGVRPPASDPALQEHVVQAADGVDLFVETWLPAELDGNRPPEKIPTILQLTPYPADDAFSLVPDAMGHHPPVEYFVSRGYAFSRAHLRGYGRSGGCTDLTGEDEIDGAARVIEYLGRDALWSNGSVGTYGKSYDADIQIAVATLGDPEKTQYLKAFVPVSGSGGQYDYNFFDGVPYLGAAPSVAAVYLGWSLYPRASVDPSLADRAECPGENLVESLDHSGDRAVWYREREYRRGAPNVRAAMLMVHGIADYNVLPLSAAGFFDRIPTSTPHKGLFGIWGHDYPDNQSVRPEWNRLDWLDMATAWFDRYLKGLETGVEDWPEVQVQGIDGRWRVEPEWPTTGGPVGQLALGSDGTLGATSPFGATLYAEGSGLHAVDPTGSKAVFSTGPLPDRLEITGQPVLDLWVSLDQPDAHLVAELEAFDASGIAIAGGFNWSMRSARHLEPILDGEFAQEQGVPAPTDTPIRLEMRLLPTDIVVPEGGSLRLTISGRLGGQRIGAFAATGITGSAPSGAMTKVTVLHDCEHPSALRFLMPRGEPEYLIVRDARAAAGEVVEIDSVVADGGLATAAVCGQAPIRPATLGPEAER